MKPTLQKKDENTVEKVETITTTYNLKSVQLQIDNIDKSIATLQQRKADLQVILNIK